MKYYPNFQINPLCLPRFLLFVRVSVFECVCVGQRALGSIESNEKKPPLIQIQLNKTFFFFAKLLIKTL